MHADIVDRLKLLEKKFASRTSSIIQGAAENVHR